MAAKALGERVQIQVRLPVDVKARLEAQAEARMVSVNYLATRAFAAYLDFLEAEEAGDDR